MRERLTELLVVIVLITAAWWYAGHRAVEDYKQEVAIEQAKADKAEQEKYDKVSTELEALKLTRQGNAKTITRTIEKIIDRPVYRDNPCMDSDGLSVINSALSGSASKFDDKMPSTK